MRTEMGIWLHNREHQRQEFLESMKNVGRDTAYEEQEKKYTEIRKQNYWRLRNEVKRGLRSSLELLEYEVWTW